VGFLKVDLKHFFYHFNPSAANWKVYSPQLFPGENFVKNRRNRYSLATFMSFSWFCDYRLIKNVPQFANYYCL